MYYMYTWKTQYTRAHVYQWEHCNRVAGIFFSLFILTLATCNCILIMYETGGMLSSKMGDILIYILMGIIIVKISLLLMFLLIT